MNEPAPPITTPAWVEARLRAYAQCFPVSPEQREAALARACGVADPARALAALRAAALDTSPGTAQWTRALLAREGIVTDPACPLMVQRLPVLRTSMAPPPLRRPPLRRVLTALVRPLGRLTRRVQPLGGRVAE